MNNIKYCLLALLCFFSVTKSFSQAKSEMSSPINLQQTGVNKVLCMKNGNTMLFHFEPRKAVVVKVFDSTHKEIATQKHICKFLDINYFDHSIFKGLYDIDGEAVLFVEQEHLSKRQLVRVRFNATTGNIDEEGVISEASKPLNEAVFSVMIEKGYNGYSILYKEDLPQFNKCNVNVSYYNNKSELLKKVDIPVNRSSFDYMTIISSGAHENGLYVAMCLYKIVQNGTEHSHGYSHTETTYDHVLLVAYIPENSSRVLEKEVNLTTDIFPEFVHYTYNSFADKINLLLFSYKPYLTNNGLDVLTKSLKSSLMLTIDPNDMSLIHNWIYNDSALNYYRSKTDTAKFYSGVPLKMFTNNNGLTTIVSQSYEQYDAVASHLRKHSGENYFGNIAITQCDDSGKEIWGTMLPFNQYYDGHRIFYDVYELGKRSEAQCMFCNLPNQVYNRQFLSADIYTFHKNFYIFYNDYNENFNNSINKPGLEVYSFDNTNACYYKLNKKRELMKSYLFGEPTANEYKTSFIEGADFDEQRGIYATLVQSRKDGETNLCMAWCHLE